MKYYLPILLLLVLFSCTNENENGLDGSEKLEDNFSITGTILGAENTSFYLEALSQQGVISVAKAQSDSKGEFKMVGNIPGYGLYQLRLGESSDLIIPLTIIPNDDVQKISNVITSGNFFISLIAEKENLS